MNSTLVAVAPFLQDALMLVVTVAVTIGLKQLQNVAAVHNNAKLSDTLTKLAWDAAHFGIEYADTKIATVRGINVADPVVATASRWLLNAADSEIKQLNLSPNDVIAAVQAILPQAKAALAPSQPATH